MAAAFTLIDMVDAYRRISPDIPISLAESWLDAMKSAGRLLVGRNELHGFISNHRAGAAGALAALNHITGEMLLLQRAWQLMDEVYDRQSAEGWFLEYEGADPGYQTLDTHYQALFYMETGSERGTGVRGPFRGFSELFPSPRWKYRR